MPAGLPSELLLRRPDLVKAEQRLAAANARVAVARSAYFPSITLTGFLGSEAAALAGLFTGPAGIWQIAATLAAPIFSGGRFEAQVSTAEAREAQALALYQSAIRNAFREVRAALAVQTRTRESVEAESARAKALASALRLARLRYDSGLASQLDVIDAERGLLWPPRSQDTMPCAPSVPRSRTCSRRSAAEVKDRQAGHCRNGVGFLYNQNGLQMTNNCLKDNGFHLQYAEHLNQFSALRESDTSLAARTARSLESRYCQDFLHGR